MYLTVLTLAILFSAFAIDLENEVWAFLATIVWFTLGLLNIGLATEPMFYAASFLFYAVGVVFFLLGVGFTFVRIQMIFRARNSDEHEMELT